MARELRDGDVHAEADAEIRDLVLTGDAAGEDLALPPARPEAAGDEHAVDAAQLGAGLVERHVLGVDPAHVHAAAVVNAGVLERLVHREVGVVQLHVLADEGDLDRLVAFLDALGQLAATRRARPAAPSIPSLRQTSSSSPCSCSASGTR